MLKPFGGHGSLGLPDYAYVAVNSFHCTQNHCRPLHFVKVFSIIEKLDLVASQREHVNRPGKKLISGFGLPPIAVTKIK